MQDREDGNDGAHQQRQHLLRDHTELPQCNCDRERQRATGQQHPPLIAVQATNQIAATLPVERCEAVHQRWIEE